MKVTLDLKEERRELEEEEGGGGSLKSNIWKVASVEPVASLVEE